MKQIRLGAMVLGLMVWGLPVIDAMATEDLKGSKDHPLLKRYEGAVIVKYTHTDFDEYTVPLGKADGNNKLTHSAVVEGEVTKLAYSIPKGRSTLEVIRNYENALKGAGYKVLFIGAKDEIGRIPQAAGWETPTYSVDTQRVLTAQGSRPQGVVHIVLFAVGAHYDQSDWGLEKGQVLLLAHIVVKKSMENKLSKVMAEEMASAISDAGSVALYGIYFDVNKAEVKAESEPMLLEMAKLLKTQPSLKLLVVGHTDNEGAFDANMELSQRRAQAVVSTLVSKHGVATERLMPVGVSFAAPVAPNKTEEGRAKNRRVELVER
jgi:OOP family OmpA-OmpF porin